MWKGFSTYSYTLANGFRNCGYFVALVHLWHLPLLYRSAFAD